jgi:phosphoribosylaminoimidazole-succinocarboxamide synthase
MQRGDLARLSAQTLRALELPALPPGTRRSSGKVRDVVTLGNELLITTTDRISAFDRVLATVPCKGEVLNTLTLFWFDRTADLVPNHLLERVSARTVRAARCEVLPVEVVVRGYLTGSALRDYQDGRPVSGIRLPPNLRPSQRFDEPLLTPSTKEAGGHHDRPVSRAELLAGGVVERGLWEEIERTALALFRRGSEVAAANGLILVDTKYEFGLRSGRLTLVDEVHTPDSSRYWFADTYAELFEAGERQRELDKEYLRQWLLARGFRGDGEPPTIPAEVLLEVAWRYVTAWQTITGSTFTPRSLDAATESALVLEQVRRAAGNPRGDGAAGASRA